MIAKAWAPRVIALALLCGGTAVAAPQEDEDLPGSRRLAPAPLEDPEALFEWGKRARDVQGCAVAEGVWMRIVEEHPASEWAAPSLYSTAVCYEAAGDQEGALALYDRVIADYADDPLIKDSLFRKGLVLEVLGRYKEAHKLYKGMLRNLELRLTPSDKEAVAIQRDIELAYLGRDRKAVKALMEHLDAFEMLDREAQEPLLYWIAKVQIVLGQVLSRHAAETKVYLSGFKGFRSRLPWRDETRMLKAQLDARGRDLLAAQGRYQSALDMGIPEWTLAAIYLMGEDHERLYRDLVSAPVPPELTEDEATIYRDEVADRSWPILVKAYRLYHHGDQLARSYRSEVVWAGRLAERTAALEKEGISAADLDERVPTDLAPEEGVDPALDPPPAPADELPPPQD